LGLFSELTASIRLKTGALLANPANGWKTEDSSR
jgi:hypothetical protein